MPEVVAECWLLTLVDGRVAAVPGPGGGFSPTWSVPVEGRQSPQEAVAAAAPSQLWDPPHSTSWRFHDGVVHLSFVAFGSSAPASGEVVAPYRPQVPAAGRPSIPFERVVQHAVRHVAFLLATDASFTCPEPDQWRQACREHLPAVFGDLTIETAP